MVVRNPAPGRWVYQVEDSNQLLRPFGGIAQCLLGGRQSYSPGPVVPAVVDVPGFCEQVGYVLFGGQQLAEVIEGIPGGNRGCSGGGLRGRCHGFSGRGGNGLLGYRRGGGRAGCGILGALGTFRGGGPVSVGAARCRHDCCQQDRNEDSSLSTPSRSGKHALLPRASCF